MAAPEVSTCSHCAARAYSYSSKCSACMLRWEARLPRRFVLARLAEREKQFGRDAMLSHAAELRRERDAG